MAQKTDWLPSVRTAQLTMAKNWSQVLGNNATLWHIPLDTVHHLTALAGEAENALTDAQNETSRAKRLRLLAWSLAA